MIRQIIHINEAVCNGCGLCAAACHEGAIGMVDGKARLLREDFCDGLGDCLPTCPTGAITFETREAPAYDETAVQAAKAPACPGTRAQALRRAEKRQAAPENGKSELAQWPVQIKLSPVRAPYFEGAELLIAADCTAYACGCFHSRFMRGRVTLIGCPKLDAVDYAEKLTAILSQNDIQSVTVVRMEVPCCGGMERAVQQAIQQSGKTVPCQVVTLSRQGEILN